MISVDGKPAGAATALTLDKGPHDIALAWPGAAPVEGGLASVQVSPGRALARFHFEAAARLSSVPRGASWRSSRACAPRPRGWS